MSKRVVGASIAAAIACLVVLWFWQSRMTVLTYTVPDELLGSTVYLDGQQVGVAHGKQFEFKVSRARHSIRLEKPGQQPALIEVDLSGQPITRSSTN